jgi:hypothetical protein
MKLDTLQLCVRRWLTVSFAVAALGWATTALPQTLSLQTRVSEGAGVTISISPSKIAGSEWAFKVVMDTHSGALADDLQQTSVLFVNGAEFRPVSWTAPADGHHREGILVFNGLATATGPVEMRVTRPGEPASRLFRWETVQ